jgi:hypothetical protein
MSHTTQLSNNWIAIHDSSPDLSAIIILRKIDDAGMAEGIDHEIPYGVLFDFVALQVRNEKISRLEQAEPKDVFGL